MYIIHFIMKRFLVIIQILLISFVTYCSSTPVNMMQILESTISIFQDDKTRAILKYAPNGVADCMLYDMEKPSAKKAAEEASLQLQRPVFDIKFKDMMDIIDNCRKLDYSRYPRMMQDSITEPVDTGNATELWSFWKGILPGTKWCGLGDEASDYTDIGTRLHVDSCCRSHDHCPVRLGPFKVGYGLLNLSLYTKSHCDCDDEFFKCLKETKTSVSEMVGNVYFNVMKFGCIKEKSIQSTTQSGRAMSTASAPKMEFVYNRKIRF